MPDFRIADTAPEHPKLRAAGLAAAGLWALAGGYAMRELTDGWVPDHWIRSWPSGSRHASTLVQAGLWTKAKRGGLAGYRFHDWAEYQRTADQITVERTVQGTRRALHGDTKLLAAVKRRDGDRCRYCGRLVLWPDRRGSGGGTYDHVIPIPAGGANAVDNVVVACRGCSSSKRSRAPDEAGMVLLPPPRSGPGPSPGPSPGLRKTWAEPDTDLRETWAEPDTGPKSVLRNPIPGPSSGSVGRGSSGNQRAGARNAPPKKPLISENRPDDRCPQHTGTDHDAPCRACMTSRKLATQWDHEQHHAAAKAASETAHATAQLRALAIDNCPLGCRDRGGYRPGGQVCDHDPQLEDRTRRGVAAVKATLTQARAARPPSDVAEDVAT